MIEGKLVNLRAQEFEDKERNARWLNDVEVSRYLSMRYQMSLAAEEQFMRDRTSKPMTFADVSMGILTKDGQQIGNCGLHEASSENRSAWLGIMIGEKEYWSRGYGSDALLTLLRFAFEEMNLNRVHLSVFDFNARGMASYRKCGFIEEGRMREAHYADGAYHDIVVMAILRDEFFALHGPPAE
jgi:RimJ/RimL family protein N-acetyltransferase